MSKIIDVITRMITNSNKISNIKKKGFQFYFSYKGYIWSTWEWDEGGSMGYSLAYYPDIKNITETTPAEQEKDFIVYSSSDFEPEALNYFQQLYNIIKEKFYGVDKVFDDILKD